ncbi:MAG: nuclear transport factor 2 family protein [Bacteroidales bacterium]|nr:nuclear transport factor 2 family protein [Bacteroidales bacterium]
MTNKQISTLVFDALNSRDFSKIIDHFSEDIIFDFPGVGEIKSSKKVLIFLKALLRKYSSLKFTLTDFIEENKNICIIWTNEGIKNDGFEYKNRGVSIFKFDDYKIVYLSDYFKDTSFTQQT